MFESHRFSNWVHISGSNSGSKAIDEANIGIVPAVTGSAVFGVVFMVL